MFFGTKYTALELITYKGSEYQVSGGKFALFNVLTVNSNSKTSLRSFSKLIVRNTAISSLVFALDANKRKDACAGRTDQFTVTIKLIFSGGVCTRCTRDQ